MATVPLLLMSLFSDSAQAFGDGVLAGDSAAIGAYTWPGIALLQTEVTYTFDGGSYTHPAAPSAR